MHTRFACFTVLQLTCPNRVVLYLLFCVAFSLLLLHHCMTALVASTLIA
jgi:hypothetical protein